MPKPKIAIIVYHKNAEKLYPKTWIEQFRSSILNQTYKDFTILEHNYGADFFTIFKKEDNMDTLSYQRHMPTFVHSMNYIINEAFSSGYDYVFNTNIDDYYALNRIERQLMYLSCGYDIVASNFHLIRDDKIVHSHLMNTQNIKVELERNNNPIGHPVVAYNKSFWKKGFRYIPEEIPTEDLKLWQRSYKEGATFAVCPDFLLYHRVHNQSVCQNPNNR